MTNFFFSWRKVKRGEYLNRMQKTDFLMFATRGLLLVALIFNAA